jgi:hypothetical protein
MESPPPVASVMAIKVKARMMATERFIFSALATFG